METLFEVQGATVQTRVGGSPAAAASTRVGAPDSADAPVPEHDLTVELTGRELSSSRHPLTWALSAFTFTLVPAITESIFEQEVRVRDAEETLGRRCPRTLTRSVVRPPAATGCSICWCETRPSR